MDSHYLVEERTVHNWMTKNCVECSCFWYRTRPKVHLAFQVLGNDGGSGGAERAGCQKVHTEEVFALDVFS